MPEAFTLFRRPLYHIPYRPDLAKKQEEKLTQALKDWEENPDDVERIIQLGRQYAYMGQYRRAIAISPSFFPAHYSLGNTLYETGDREGAAREWRKTLELNPQHEGAMRRLQAQG